MAGDDELNARAVLFEMQLRIAEGPYSALGIDGSATAEDVRGAFLALTKQFHPARFGRMSPEIQRLSNEVFLGIKGAHDQLQKALGGSIRGGFVSQSGAIPAQAEGTARTAGPATIRRTGPVPFGGPAPPGARGPQFRTQLGTGAPPAPQQQTPPLARGTDRSGTPNPAGPRAPGPNVTPSAGTPRPAASSPGQRPSSPVVSRTMTPSTAPTNRPGTPPAGIPAQRTTPTSGIPAQRTPPLGVPIQQQTSTSGMRPGTPPPRTSPPPGAPPRPSNEINPGTIRYSGVQPTPTTNPGVTPAAKPAGAAVDERTMLRECMMMLNEQKWTEARTSLNQLAAKAPQAKSYRALLCYARGREAHVAGRLEEAQLEYQRALQLEPELDLAKQAIAELAHRR